jgi:hypothetical protein
MELAGDETKGKKRSIDQVNAATEIMDEKKKTKAEQEQEATEEEKTVEESPATDNPLLNLKFSASQNILDDVPRQKVPLHLPPPLPSVVGLDLALSPLSLDNRLTCLI